MSKVTAPLLSFGASGQIAQTQVYSKWRGIPYVRRYAIPNNPKTAGQQAVRGAFSTLNSMWLFASSVLTDPYDTQATGRGYTGRNKFVGDNVRLVQGQADMSAFQASPGARGGLPASGLVLTPGTELLTVTQTLPEVPTGWTLDGAGWVAFQNQDPAAGFSGGLVTGTETTDESDFDITGLEASEEYVVSVFLEWTKPNGQTAYSISLTGTGTPTA